MLNCLTYLNLLIKTAEKEKEHEIIIRLLVIK